MDIQTPSGSKFNTEKYSHLHIKYAREFTHNLLREVNYLIKSVVLFGSTVTQQLTADSDIDLLILIDDINNKLDKKTKDTYQLLVNTTQENVSNRLHITTMTLTEFWDLTRKGDPLIIPILRHGVALFDKDFFLLAQNLLKLGKVTPSKETLEFHIARSLDTLQAAPKLVSRAALQLCYAIFDITHALFIVHKHPTTSLHTMHQDYINNFTSNQHKKLAQILKDFLVLYKNIEHGKTHVSGSEFSELSAQAQYYIDTTRQEINIAYTKTF